MPAGASDPFKNGVGVGSAEKAPERVAAAPAPVAKTSDPFGPPATAAATVPDPKTVAKTDPPPAATEVDPFGQPVVGGNTTTPAAPMPTTGASAEDIAAENAQNARSMGMAIGSILKGPGITVGPRMVPGPPRPASPFGGTPMQPPRVNPMPPPAPMPMPPAAPRPMPPVEDDPFAPAKPAEQP
jgi:hypothetical protein